MLVCIQHGGTYSTVLNVAESSRAKVCFRDEVLLRARAEGVPAAGIMPCRHKAAAKEVEVAMEESWCNSACRGDPTARCLAVGLLAPRRATRTGSTLTVGTLPLFLVGTLLIHSIHSEGTRYTTRERRSKGAQARLPLKVARGKATATPNAV